LLKDIAFVLQGNYQLDKKGVRRGKKEARL
jgi:hypothetical protein